MNISTVLGKLKLQRFKEKGKDCKELFKYTENAQNKPKYCRN